MPEADRNDSVVALGTAVQQRSAALVLVGFDLGRDAGPRFGHPVAVCRGDVECLLGIVHPG